VLGSGMFVTLQTAVALLATGQGAIVVVWPFTMGVAISRSVIKRPSVSFFIIAPGIVSGASSSITKVLDPLNY